MLTQCPKCQTIYQITASELAAANAFVECGECGSQFNALDRIADEPSFERNEQSADTEQADFNEPETADEEISARPAITLLEESSQEESATIADESREEISPQDDIEPPIQEASAEAQPTLFPEPDLSESAESEEALDTTVELEALSETDIPQIGIEQTTDDSHTSLPPEEHEILFTEPGQDADEAVAESEEDKVVSADEIDIEEVPPILQEELLALQGNKKQSTGWYWSVIAVLFFIGLLAQGSWYYRDALLKEFPQLREPAFSLCQILGCTLESAEKNEPIQLVSRDVRTHPRYENAVLVNASMVNTSAETIAFPTVQLGLFDNTGTAIGIRQFSPAEYLDKSIDIQAGIPPGRSVHVVMELANAGPRATSFEFSFY